MLHFVKMKDQYDHYHFIYVDDYEKYGNTESDKLPLSYVNKHIIEIGSRRFENNLRITDLVSLNPPKSHGLCKFFIDTEKNPGIFDVDFKDGVRIYDKNSMKIVFHGFIDHSEHVHNSQFFVCLGSDKFLSHTKVSIETHGMHAIETMYFLARAAGKNVNLDEPTSSQIFSQREFVIIMPIGNLALQESVTIANTTIYHKLDSYEDFMIRKSSMIQHDSNWDGNNLRIRTKVSADNFFDAVMEGYRKISTIIDCLAFRSDFSFPKYESNGNDSDVQFSLYRFFSRIKIFPKIFCRQIGAESHLFFDLQTITENRLVFDYQATRFFDVVKNLFEPILSKDLKNMDQNEHSILLSLHWLRLGIFSNEFIEKIMFLYNALEFSMSTTTSNKKFSKDELKDIQTKINELILSEDQKKRIDNKISELNSSSLFEKVEQYCHDNSISVTEEEWKNIRSTRKKRNDIIHGKKDVKVNLDEIEKLQTLIEKIILKRVNIIE